MIKAQLRFKLKCVGASLETMAEKIRSAQETNHLYTLITQLEHIRGNLAYIVWMDDSDED